MVTLIIVNETNQSQTAAETSAASEAAVAAVEQAGK